MSTHSVKSILGRSFSYKQQLMTPQWAAFKREVRWKKGNACEICKRGDQVMNVHHWFYDPERSLWEYELWEVSLLCEICHQEMHKRLNEFRQFVFPKLTPNVFRVLNSALVVGLQFNDPLKLAYAIAEMSASPGSVERFCNYWHAQPNAETQKPEVASA